MTRRHGSRGDVENASGTGKPSALVGLKEGVDVCLFCSNSGGFLLLNVLEALLNMSRTPVSDAGDALNIMSALVWGRRHHKCAVQRLP